MVYYSRKSAAADAGRGFPGAQRPGGRRSEESVPDMAVLEQIHSPQDVQRLEPRQMQELCAELRTFLVESVSRTGGHLASNLGAVELTVAIHRVFDTSRDRLVFDVGHQCYVHKALTGRRELFSTLRQLGGISGYPQPAESVHDAFIAGHASNSVSVALGMARARTLQNQDYRVLALIGDGALTGGLSYEGLNNAGASGEPLIVILNDNGMSIASNVGGMARHLSYIRTRASYYRFKKFYRKMLRRLPGGRGLYRFNHRVKTAVKKLLFPCTMFEDMGFTYLGPVDGHNLEQLCTTLRWARELSCPVLVHVKTQKGRGYPAAQANPDRFHGVGPFDPETGAMPPAAEDFSAVFGQTMERLAEEEPRVCAITAAMVDGTGLRDFARYFPDRFFDVGIAEGHAVAMAAGMARQGLVPVFAVYSSFLQRGYDMLLHDVALQNLHVVFAVDRAGLVGADGPTHHGVADVGYLSQIPGMTVLAPASFQELRDLLRRAVLELPGPAAVRYPRGGEGEYRAGWSGEAADRLLAGADVTIVTYGTLTNEALRAARLLAEKGISADVIKLNRIAPLPLDLALESVSRTGRLVMAEDCFSAGSVGERLSAALAQAGIGAEIRLANLGQRFVPQGTVPQLLRSLGLDAQGICACAAEVCHGEQ